MNGSQISDFVLSRYPNAKFLSSEIHEDEVQLRIVWMAHLRVFERNHYERGKEVAEKMLAALNNTRIAGKIVRCSLRKQGEEKTTGIFFNSSDLEITEIPDDFVRFIDTHWDDY